MFWDIPAPWPVWLSGAFSQRKITANSTYWKAKLWWDGLEQGEMKQNTAIGGVGVFRDLVLGCCREGNGGEKISPHTLPEGHHFLDLIRPDLVQKMANSGTCFQNTRIMRLFQENTADYRFKMYANRRDWKADRRWHRP